LKVSFPTSLVCLVHRSSFCLPLFLSIFLLFLRPSYFISSPYLPFNPPVGHFLCLRLDSSYLLPHRGYKGSSVFARIFSPLVPPPHKSPSPLLFIFMSYLSPPPAVPSGITLASILFGGSRLSCTERGPPSLRSAPFLLFRLRRRGALSFFSEFALWLSSGLP